MLGFDSREHGVPKSLIATAGNLEVLKPPLLSFRSYYQFLRRAQLSRRNIGIKVLDRNQLCTVPVNRFPRLGYRSLKFEPPVFGEPCICTKGRLLLW